MISADWCLCRIPPGCTVLGMSTMTRRSAVRLLAATAAAVPFDALRAQTPRLPLAFSTLGCPAWPWRTILDVAAREGYAAIELRGLQGELDLPKRPEFSPATLPATRADLRARDIRVVCLGSSVQLHHRDAATRARHADDGRRFIDLAATLEAPYVRVFGDRLHDDEPREAGVARVAEGLRQLAGHARGSGVEIVIESHGDFTDSPTLTSILEAAGDGVALLWDAHHTVVAGKEAPAQTFSRLGRWVRHTHLKDSRPDATGRRYVLTGDGDVPVLETVRVLRAAGYTGYYCFEWEKMWHPEIEDPEVAIPHFARLMRDTLAQPAA
jgi:sugar phosphate isomerase/epimerase